MESREFGSSLLNQDAPGIVPRRRRDDVRRAAGRPTMRIDQLNSKNELLSGLPDKSENLNRFVDPQVELRRTSSGYHSQISDSGNGSLKKSDEFRKIKSDLRNVKPRIDTGLGSKKTVSGPKIPEIVHGKRSEPIVPKHRKYSGTFKIPDLPTSSSFNRNVGNRRSLTRLFTRNGEKEKRTDKHNSEIRTPFGSCKESSDEEVQTPSTTKRSNFLNKRSITSLSLFNKKDDDAPNIEPKERKNSISRLRAARSSLDLSSLGLSSISRASSKATLSELKEEGERKLSDRCDRPWFDLTRVWKDQTKDLPAEEMLQKMRKERSGRAKTVPSGLGGSVDNTPRSVENPEQDVPDSAPILTSAHTPSTLKKTVHLLSPDVLTNWYEKRKRVDSLYGPRRNSVSNLFFQPDKKQSSPLTELKNGDKMRKSMLNLEELLVADLTESSGKGVQRSESAKLSNERTRWRGRGIQRSESARLITMRQSPVQHRQNSHPNLVNQQSYSSSSSSLADRSSIESPSKLTTCSLTATDPFLAENTINSDSDLEAEADPPDWRHSLSEEQLARLSPKEVKRQDVINEFFHTEKSHVRYLKVLDSVFRQPLMEKGRLPRELSARLFGNLNDVLQLHQTYNTAMKARTKAGFPIGDIGDILTDMFLDGNGDKFVGVCGEFVKHQNQSIEELKRTRARDAKLELFLAELERKPACRRLQLQSILPMTHQRLVKYPLLLEQIAKYTDHREDSSEHGVVVAAMEKTRQILDSINQLVADQQNKERLVEIQVSLDTSGLDKMGSDHPVNREYKNLDLTRHELVHDGILNLKLGDSKRVKQLHVLLLKECMMLLQKQGDKYLLKFHNNQSQTGSSESRRAFHSPIIKYSTMLVRPVATDKRAFYLLNTTDSGPQIYEMLANSTSERTKWIKYITDVSAHHKAREGMPPKMKSEPEALGSVSDKKEKDLRSQSFREPGSPRLTRADRQNSSPPECPLTPPDTDQTESEKPKKRLQRVEILKIVDDEPMINPSQVRVNEAKVLVADPIITPLEKLRQKDEEVTRILDEKQKLIGQILQIPEEHFDMITDIASNSLHKREVREVLLAALGQARSLTQVVNQSLKVTEEDLVSRGSPVRDLPSTLTSTGDQLVQISSSMNQHLTELVGILQEREQERDLLKRELAKYQDQVRGYLRSQSTTFPSPPPISSRPQSFISVESDGLMDLESDPARPHSIISIESDTADCPPTDEDEEVVVNGPVRDVDGPGRNGNDLTRGPSGSDEENRNVHDNLNHRSDDSAHIESGSAFSAHLQSEHSPNLDVQTWNKVSDVQSMTSNNMDMAPKNPSGLEMAPKNPPGLDTAPNDPNGVDTAPNDPNGVDTAPNDPNGVDTTPNDPTELDKVPNDPCGVDNVSKSPCELDSMNTSNDSAKQNYVSDNQNNPSSMDMASKTPSEMDTAPKDFPVLDMELKNVTDQDIETNIPLEIDIAPKNPTEIKTASHNPAESNLSFKNINSASENPDGLYTASENPPGLDAAPENISGLATASENISVLDPSSDNPSDLETASGNPPGPDPASENTSVLDQASENPPGLDTTPPTTIPTLSDAPHLTSLKESGKEWTPELDTPSPVIP